MRNPEQTIGNLIDKQKVSFSFFFVLYPYFPAAQFQITTVLHRVMLYNKTTKIYFMVILRFRITCFPCLLYITILFYTYHLMRIMKRVYVDLT